MTPAQVLHVAGVRIEEVDFDTISRDDIAAWLQYDALMTAESPTTPFELGRRGVGRLPDFVILRLFVARDPDASIVADGWAVTTRGENNQHICPMRVGVRQDCRGRGIAQALLRLVVEAAELENRSLLVGWTSDAVPAGEGFARRVGAQPAQVFHATRLALSDVNRDLLAAWIDDGRARAKDYSLLAIDGPIPDDMIQPVVDLRRIMNTAPRGTLEMEPPMMTVEQVRKMQTFDVTVGHERWTLLARHNPTGALVGWTEVAYHPEEPTIVHQWGTGVRPAHRGHGLGKWLKAAMLERLITARPDVIEVRTGTSEANDAMRGINAELGFKPYVAATAWQAPVARVRERLSSTRHEPQEHHAAARSRAIVNTLRQ